MALRAKIKKNDMSKLKKIIYFTRSLPEFINSYVIIRKPSTLDFAIRYALLRRIKQIQKYKQVKLIKSFNQKQNLIETIQITAINKLQKKYKG